MSEIHVSFRITHIHYATTFDTNGKPMDLKTFEPGRLIANCVPDQRMFFDLMIEDERGQIAVVYDSATETFTSESTFKTVTVVGIISDARLSNIGQREINPLDGYEQEN